MRLFSRICLHFQASDYIKDRHGLRGCYCNTFVVRTYSRLLEHQFPSRLDLRRFGTFSHQYCVRPHLLCLFLSFLFLPGRCNFMSWPRELPFSPEPSAAYASLKYFGKLNASPSPTRIIPDPDSHEANPGPKGSRSTVVRKFNSNCGKQLGG
jgi:hypothetical protein